MGEIGQRLGGRYELGEPIGAGGMGVVLRARDVRLGRDVAVKILPPDRVGDATARERLLREAMAAASLTHGGIVQVFDVGDTEDGGAYLVMELVKGVSLRRLVESGTAKPSEMVRWIIDAARALAGAHAAGLVHRDVKPDNIMVRDDGRVVLLDFGLAKSAASSVAQEKALTQDGVVVGTPAYLAPEQAEGGVVGPPADQFALAVTTYEALTGTVPWRGSSAAAIIAEVLRDEPPPITTRSPALPRELDGILARALSKRPADRFANIAAFADALAELLPALGVPPDRPASLAATESVDLRSVQTPPRTEGTVVAEARARRTRPRGLFLAGALAALASLVGVGVLFRPSAEPAASLEVADVVPATSLGVADVAPGGPAPTAVADVPVPPSRNADALAAYRAGMQALHDGSTNAMRAAFQRAVDLDPTYGSALFRLAHVVFIQNDPTLARELYSKAMALRATMPEREQLLMNAEEPVVLRMPPDIKEAVSRQDALAARFPGDAEMHCTVAWLLTLEGEGPADHAADRALAIDPSYASAWLLKGMAIRQMPKCDHRHHEEAGGTEVCGDDEELQAYEACVRAAPGASICLANHARLLSDRGECDRFSDDVERLIASAPSDPVGYRYRANALLAHGGSREALDEATRQWLAVDSESQRVLDRPAIAESSAFVYGDFAEAERVARAEASRLESSRDIVPHSRQTRALVDALVETGRASEGRGAELGYLHRVSLWNAQLDLDSDETPWLLGAAERAGAITHDQWDDQRTAWEAQEMAQLGPFRSGRALSCNRARAVWTRAEAESALDQGWDYSVAETVSCRAALGEVYRLAGRIDSAIPMLERATRSCQAFDHPVDLQYARMHLAQALETKGDAPGACAAYAAVLSRWGDAKPRSVTAEQARARRTALACKP